MNSCEQPDLDRATCSAALAAFIAEARDLRRAATADPVRGRRRLVLREWQVARLARTHADLLGSERYGAAATFFLSDLYSPKDCGERDAELERILPLMTSMLPVSGLRALLLAIEVDALSERFDGAMVEVLGAHLDGAGMDEAAYADAYRKVGDRPGRETQIRLINETMMEHPMHMHGAFFVVDNGKGERAPLKHTVIVKPGETITVHTSFDDPGPWVFHCHLFYHAAAGMVQALVVK